MNVPNAAAAIILTKLVVKSVVLGAIAGGVIIGMCYKGYNDGKKERAQ